MPTNLTAKFWYFLKITSSLFQHLDTFNLQCSYPPFPQPFCLLVILTLKGLVVLMNALHSSFVSLICTLQFSSVAQLCLTLRDPMNRSTPGLPVHHQLPEFTQTHVHWVGDAIQPSHPLSSPSPPAHKLSQHQGLFKWVSSLHQVAKGLEFQLQHQSFQWIFRTYFL